FAGGENAVQVVARADYKIQRFQPSVTAGVPEVDHFDVVIFNVLDQIGPGKLFCRLVEVLHQRIGVQFSETCHESVVFYLVIAAISQQLFCVFQRVGSCEKVLKIRKFLLSASKIL
ncbi:hypothetical protein RZS08_02950, partial [Arthrospira platensis SPKY1]|nr:hypothetical protein [Arthrospira platensis SPKY1]